ncbi:Uncharacterised protein [Pseudomonas aeruginosa]|nr:Uncharacterised protein [Pseudomonas aeruginosa]
MCMSIISEMRRSDSEPISANARARLSAAIATGSAWKLPPEITSPSAANTSGLSDTALASISSTSAAWRIWVRQAPITCGWQRSDRVLDLVALLMGTRHLAAGGEQVAIGRGHVDLPTLAARGVDARIERRPRTEHGLDAEAAADGGGGEQVLGLEQPAQRVGGGHLGAIEQGQAFLRRQGQRLQPGHRQRSRPAATHRDGAPAFADQHQRHVRQRRQVAGRTHRAFQRDVRIDLGVDQRDQRVDHLAADAGEPARQAVHLEQHDQPHHGVVQRLADAGGMGQDDGTLSFSRSAGEIRVEASRPKPVLMP